MIADTVHIYTMYHDASNTDIARRQLDQWGPSHTTKVLREDHENTTNPALSQ